MLTFDLSEFQRKAREIEAAIDQVPLALANAMNTAALNTRQMLIDDVWPRYVEVRDRNFLRNALRVEKATKRSLSVSITSGLSDTGKRGHLRLHADGGTKLSRGSLAFPDWKILGRRTSKGMPQSLRPKNIPNSFRKGDVIYRRTGSYQKAGNGQRGIDNRHLELMYTLGSSAPVRADVPFRAEFIRNMRREMMGQFKLAMMQAMRTRR